MNSKQLFSPFIRLGRRFIVKFLRGGIILGILYWITELILNSFSIHIPAAQQASLVIIALISWISFCAISILEMAAESFLNLEQEDNLRARSILTQVHVVQNVGYFIILLIGIGTSLMTFQEVRQIGSSILASAGVLGIVFGFAAQKAISNLLAGIQIALTQPIRIGDVVVIEEEWGKIEDITLTYVVVAIWDQRRLILPIQYFLEKPFQNWTRESSEILAPVFILLDFQAPVSKVRECFEKLVHEHPLWDRRVCNTQVTEITAEGIQVRGLASARSGSDAWDLRCDIREKWLETIVRDFPDALPHRRLDVRRVQSKVV